MAEPNLSTPLPPDASDEERRAWLEASRTAPSGVSFGGLLSAKARDERGTGFAIMDRIFNGSELFAQDDREGGPLDSAALEKATAGLGLEDTFFLLENGRRGPASMRAAQARLAMRKETDAVTEQAGVWANVGADILVDLANPIQWGLTGVLGVATMGGRAAYALNKAGGAAARAAATKGPATFAGRLAEDAAINVAQGALWGSLRDTLGGDVMGVTDYAADVAGAVVFTAGLHGAAAGVSHIARKMRALSGDPQADGIVGDLRAAGLEPPYVGKVESGARATPEEAQANAAAQARVVQQAEAELMSPPGLPDDELFDEAYRKALAGEAPSEPASAPLAKPEAEGGALAPTGSADRDSGPGDALRFGFFTKPDAVPAGAVADPTTNLSWSPPEGGATHWETRKGYGKFYERVRAGEKQAPHIVGDSPPVGPDGKPILTPGEVAQANTDLLMQAIDSTPMPGKRITVTISPEARTRGGVKEAQLYREVLESLQTKYLPDDALPIQLAVVGIVGGDMRARGIALPGHKGNLIGMQAGLGEVGVRTLVHEFAHVMTFEWGKYLTSDEWGALVKVYKSYVDSQDPVERGLRRYAAGSSTFASARDGAEALADVAAKGAKRDEYTDSMAEFAAEQFVKFIQKDPLGRGLPAKAVHVIKGMVKRLMALFQDAKHRKLLDAEEAFEDLFQAILDGKLRGRIPRETAGAMGPVVAAGEIKGQLSMHDYAERRVVGAARTAATDKMRKGLYDRAVSFMMANPVKTERLRTINKHVAGALSPGLHMAGSANAGIQLLAAKLVETTTGAAGRGNTAAVLMRVTQQKILGTSLREYTSAWRAWAGQNGVPITRRFGINEHRTRFDREVRAEMLRRRGDDTEVLEPMHPVRMAADALDRMNQRGADEGRAANIVGAANLPERSRGYFTQKLSGQAIIDIDRAQPGAQKALEARLGEHFSGVYGIEPELGLAMAQVYVRRAVDRTFGNGQGPHMDESGSVVRSLREEMEHMADGIDDPALKQKLAESVKGMSNTRKRLDIPLDDPEVARFFETNLLGLARGYVHRMAAEVATTKVGLLGLKGVKELREAALAHGPKPTKQELDAVDQVVAEMFGTPVHGAVTSVPAQNVRSLTAAVRLGGAVFAQAGDMMNVAAALGTQSALRWIPALARHISDIRAINRGGETQGILQGTERWGGQIGMRDYLIDMPLDAPETALTSYSEQPGIITQIIRHVSHASQGINFFRGFVAVQHRHVAEEVLKHVVDLHLGSMESPVIVDGKAVIKGLTPAIRDMGFTEDLISRLGPAIRLENGRVKGFDPALLSHKDAETFTTALHRGVAQMIQSNFVGENNAWAHNDWVKIMTQFRTFSITAMEKQWARRRAVAAEDGGMLDGYAHIGGMLAAQMAVGALLYTARVHSQTIGMSEKDRRKRLDKAFTPAAIATGALNASTLSGYTGEVFSALGAMQSWMPDAMAKQVSTGSHGAGRGDRGSSVLDSVPAVGYLEQATKAIQKLPEKNGVHNLAKVLPGANSPLVLPFLNALKD